MADFDFFLKLDVNISAILELILDNIDGINTKVLKEEEKESHYLESENNFTLRATVSAINKQLPGPDF